MQLTLLLQSLQHSWCAAMQLVCCNAVGVLQLFFFFAKISEKNPQK
jgi:hypothetical protein